MQARAATPDDLERVHALLIAAGVNVDRASLQRRLAESDGGIMLASSATISWTMDGAALHLYDIAGAPEELRVLVDLITAIAHEQLAVVLVATLYAGDRIVAVLEASGFERDWEEADVANGHARTLLGYIRSAE